MLKATTLAFAATLMAAPAATAQTIDLGRGGPQIDLRSNGQRERDYRREQTRRDMSSDRYRDRDRSEYGRRGYDRDDMSTGSARRRDW